MYATSMAQLESVWRVLTLRCNEATRLASESLDHPLPFEDRLAMRLHRMICRSCRRYGRQVVELRRISTRLAEQTDPPASAMPLPEEARERIKRTLKGS
jgi:hypothetical protein